MSKINYKIQLMGNFGVGKEIFLKKLPAGEYYEKYKSTIGIEKKTIDLDLDVMNKEGKSIKKKFVISFYDNIFQEKFRSFNYSYFRDTDGIFFIYDITNISTFLSVEDRIDSINESSLYYKKKYAIFLIGNKLDLVEKEIREREVFEDEAKQLCNKYNMIWGGEQSLDNLDFKEFIKLIGKYVGEIYKIVGEGEPNEQKIKHKKNIEKIAEEKESRIKKNSCPSDGSDE